MQNIIYNCTNIEIHVFTDLPKWQSGRLNLLHSICEKYNFKRDVQDLNETELVIATTKFITDDIHKIIIKAIPKTGSSSWKRTLLTHSPYFKHSAQYTKGWNTMRDQYHLLQLSTFNKSIILKKLRTYLTILNVRHPLSRLESGFRNIIIHYRNANETPVYNTSFFERFQRFLDKRISEDEYMMNVHFKPTFAHTLPCTIPFG